MQGEKRLKPKLFYAKSIVDMIPRDNFYFKLKAILDWSFLRKELVDYYSKIGRPSLDPIVFFKLNLVGCLEGLAEDRDLIRKCTLRLDILYFLNYDIDEALPDHSTVSRTRHKIPKEIFEKLFKHMLKQCVESGMVLSGETAIDSAYIKANASLESLKERKQVDMKGYLKEVRGVNNQDDRERQINNPNKKEKKSRSNKDYYSPTDTDAKIARKSGTPTNLYYSAVASVDVESNLLCSLFAGLSDKHDSVHLIESVKQTQSNHELNGRKVENVVADGAFTSLRNLKDLEQMDITGYMPLPSNFKLEREGFTYDKEEDDWTCRNGKKLEFKRISKSKRGSKFKDYKTRTSDCKNCPYKNECIPNQSVKKISISVDSEIYKELDKRNQTKTGKRLMRKRKASVEPALGQLKNQLGLRKIFTKGLDAANRKMLMTGIAYNLKKWLGHLLKMTGIAKSNVKMKENKKGIHLFYFLHLLTFNYSCQIENLS